MAKKHDPPEQEQHADLLPEQLPLGEVTVERNPQIQLFEGLVISEKYSRTAEIYDGAPRFGGSRLHVDRVNGKFLDPYIEPFFAKRKVFDTEKGEFVSKSFEYEVEINPAKIKKYDLNKKSKDVYVDFFPGKREELIEDALRHISSRPGRACIINNHVAVRFTLRELQKELARHNHKFSIPEIREGIEVMATSVMDIREKNGGSIKSPLFPLRWIPDRKEWEKSGGDCDCYVCFHPLITKSVMELGARQLFYEVVMRLKRQVAVWFMKRMSHYYTYASPDTPYQVLLTSIIRDAGLKKSRRLRDHKKDIEEALQELVDEQVIQPPEPNIIFGGKRGTKVEDVFYELFATEAFFKEMRKANQRHKEMLATEEAQAILSDLMKDAAVGAATGQAKLPGMAHQDEKRKSLSKKQLDELQQEAVKLVRDHYHKLDMSRDESRPGFINTVKSQLVQLVKNRYGIEMNYEELPGFDD